MKELIEIVKNKKRENIILGLLLLIFCLFNIFINLKVYRNVLLNEYTTINSYNDLKKAYKNQDNFLIIDLSNAKLERYKLQDSANIYTLNLDGNNILILLKENTLITNMVNVQISLENYIITDIKEKLVKNNYDNIVLTNIDFNTDIKFQKYKIYSLLIIGIISILLIIFNIIGFINPQKGKYYKKLERKYCK